MATVRALQEAESEIEATLANPKALVLTVEDRRVHKPAPTVRSVIGLLMATLFRSTAISPASTDEMTTTFVN